MIDFSLFDKDAKLTEIETTTFKYDFYKLVYFNSPYDHERKIWYVMGESLNEESKTLRYDNFDILLSILKLGNLIEPTWEKYGGLMDDESQLKYSDEIIEWCKIHGLPYYSNFFMENYAKGKKIPFGGFRAFDLFEFKRRILVLSDRFNLWYGITYGDIKFVLKYDRLIKPKNKTYTEKDLRNLKQLVTNIPIGSLKLSYNIRKDKYDLVPCAADTIDVAYFQLALLMTNKRDERIKYCDKCLKPFIYEHGNTSYCNSCNRELNRNYVKEHRMREKREILKLYNNGESIENLAKDYKKTVSQIQKWIKEDKV